VGRNIVEIPVEQRRQSTQGSHASPEDSIEGPKVQQSMHPPSTDGVEAVTMEMIVETRDALDALVAAADHAESTCEETAPLAKALRAAIARERAELGGQLSVGPAPSLPKRFVELRASATLGLKLLQEALDEARGGGSGAECGPAAL